MSFIVPGFGPHQLKTSFIRQSPLSSGGYTFRSFSLCLPFCTILCLVVLLLLLLLLSVISNWCHNWWNAKKRDTRKNHFLSSRVCVRWWWHVEMQQFNTTGDGESENQTALNHRRTKHGRKLTFERHSHLKVFCFLTVVFDFSSVLFDAASSHWQPDYLWNEELFLEKWAKLYIHQNTQHQIRKQQHGKYWHTMARTKARTKNTLTLEID